MIRPLLNKLERFEIHHKILIFTAVLILTIVFVRSVPYLYDPNPVLFNVELHHFDYGIIFLLVAVKLLLFGSKKYYFLYLLLSSVASGLIIDDYLFIRKSVVESTLLRRELYDSTLPYVVVSIITGTLLILFINAIRNKNKLK